jgi:hypothetical protein
MIKWTEISNKTKIIVSTVVLVVSSSYGAYSFLAEVWDEIVTEAEATESRQVTLMMIYELKLQDARDRLSYLNRLDNKTSDEEEEVLYQRKQIDKYTQILERMQCEQLGQEECD